MRVRAARALRALRRAALLLPLALTALALLLLPRPQPLTSSPGNSLPTAALKDDQHLQVIEVNYDYTTSNENNLGSRALRYTYVYNRYNVVEKR